MAANVTFKTVWVRSVFGMNGMYIPLTFIAIAGTVYVS
jgi:hypothetical protein